MGPAPMYTFGPPSRVACYVVRDGTEHATRITAYWQVKERVNEDLFSRFFDVLSVFQGGYCL